MDFKWKSNLIRFIFLKDYSGNYIEDKLQEGINWS